MEDMPGLAGVWARILSDDMQYLLKRTKGGAGCCGASSIERPATESIIEEQARRFKAIRVNR